MRAAFLCLGLLLAGCNRGDQPANAEQPSGGQPPAAAAILTFAGEGRDRLCLNERESRAAFVTYGQGDMNCTAQGALQGSGETLAIVPDGDGSCRVPVSRTGDTVRLGGASAACAYYCGPTASYAGRTFKATPAPVPVTDLAGEPLC